MLGGGFANSVRPLTERQSDYSWFGKQEVIRFLPVKPVQEERLTDLNEPAR